MLAVEAWLQEQRVPYKSGSRKTLNCASTDCVAEEANGNVVHIV